MPEQDKTEEEIRELNRRWAEAETRGDVAALDALAADGFRLVGPVGFVLDKQQWLDRYRLGDFVTASLRFEDVETRRCGDTAISIGRHPADGEFRTTLIAARDGGQWRLAGCQVGPIGGPPPFPPPGGRP